MLDSSVMLDLGSPSDAPASVAADRDTPAAAWVDEVALPLVFPFTTTHSTPATTSSSAPRMAAPCVAERPNPTTARLGRSGGGGDAAAAAATVGGAAVALPVASPHGHASGTQRIHSSVVVAPSSIIIGAEASPVCASRAATTWPRLKSRVHSSYISSASGVEVATKCGSRLLAPAAPGASAWRACSTICRSSPRTRGATRQNRSAKGHMVHTSLAVTGPGYTSYRSEPVLCMTMRDALPASAASVVTLARKSRHRESAAPSGDLRAYARGEHPRIRSRPRPAPTRLISLCNVAPAAVSSEAGPSTPAAAAIEAWLASMSRWAKAAAAEEEEDRPNDAKPTVSR
mmetsp:Transcript_3027/g.7574  ORF Transcript_3027/g.7574 Transcript_3027/m.7574 type:complete len:344 (-) Transcript_3027:846-1877(-)